MPRLLKLLLIAGLVAGLSIVIRRLLEEQNRDEPDAARSTPGPSSRPGRAGSSNGARAPSKAELYREAQRLEVQGRSKMSKQELARAVAAARGQD